MIARTSSLTMNAVIFGANGGLGSALIRELVTRDEYDAVFAVSREQTALTGAISLFADPLDEASLDQVAQEISDRGRCHLCIVATGLLSDGETVRPERSFRDQSHSAFEQVFAVNTVAPALIAKHMLPLVPKDERSVFAALSARVGSLSDNRLGGWHAYRASKAALNMLIKNYAIELSRKSREFIAVGLHPGTVDTPLSKPFQKNVPSQQLFTPEHSARCLLDVLSKLTPADSGKVVDWAGMEIPT